MLLHGLTEAGTTWPDLVGHWGDDWHALAPDLRGHGQSPRFTEDQLGAAPEVPLADVVTVLEAQPEPVALVGHSLGGLLALRAAIARPARTDTTPALQAPGSIGLYSYLSSSATNAPLMLLVDDLVARVP